MVEKYLPVTPEMKALAANYPVPEWMPMGMVAAFEFAREAHKNQFRKYTGDPYIVHPIDVLRRMVEGIHAVSYNPVIEARLMEKMRPTMMACLLHDTVEDCDVSLSTIEKEFGFDVAEAVFWVTDTLTSAQGNRGTRKRLEAARIAAAPLEFRCLKLCDLGSNTESIVACDPDFAVVYIKEKAHLLSIIGDRDTGEETATVALFHYLMSKAVANTVM